MERRRKGRPLEGGRSSCAFLPSWGGHPWFSALLVSPPRSQGHDPRRAAALTRSSAAATHPAALLLRTDVRRAGTQAGHHIAGRALI